MPIFRRRPREPHAPPRVTRGDPGGRDPTDLVKLYLRGQNLEQLRRFEEAAALYEQAVVAGFDSAGPYDRLIAIYREREANADVVRVAESALRSVRTFDTKRAWYEQMRDEAAERARNAPDPRGAEF